ncbi:helix-turn-helix domain-containing protein [Shewanella sp. JNE10-2]|uniref:helix-turn-helix transcriptional regulator n=1 Tax=unclassified Shewanella TaxID=196818 RepID=UPI00200385B4|nr:MULTISPECIES: helix-turn-helix transcriptional regulator [unclassified Shewanella]MCK7632126.1 helix-turn-helix domain-containing protein [Shewanella sp. JNE9-1]MCK7636257.1 helix-turn-helix domain-containing protein [Shewanella sp. JNE17]MCK7647290.1 helix-turn-helix domain-containing protein [Shewanella sp. JNE3-1]MCK7651428.1 helix-turn-helix domain-containing protein [Shewanella sp. JNE8]MCK7655452.1 helix-turn-helix domain-containing protein [Shewanella sp. JNE4-1]
MTVSSNVATDSIETKGRGGRKKISVNRKPLTLKDREDLLLAATLDLFSGKKTQGQVLKWLRVELLSLSQDQYAKMVGVSRKALSDIESDKGKNGVEFINRVFSGVGFRIALMPKDSVVLKMAVEAI